MTKLFYFKRNEKNPIIDDNQLIKGVELRKYIGSPRLGEPFVYENHEKITEQSKSKRGKED